MQQLVNVVPIDGRKAGKATAEATMLDCLARLKDGKYDACTDWLLHEIMRKCRCYNETLQAVIDEFEGVNSFFLKGMQLYHGYGVVMHDAEAVKMFNEGIRLGDQSGGCHHMAGRCYELEDDDLHDDKAAELYQEAVALGNIRAHASLGNAYREGRIVERDLYEAARLYTLGHLGGDLDATFFLGVAYQHGEGVEEDLPLAAALFREATVRRGNHQALTELQFLQEDDPSSVVSFSCWRPVKHLHKWVTAPMDRQIVCLLIAKRRPDGFIQLLPREIILRICFYLVCRPT